MSGNAPGNHPFPGQGAVYWRRRVIALAAGIAMLGLIVWTINGALGGGTASPSAQVSQIRGHHARPAAAGRASVPATASPEAAAQATRTPARPSGPGRSSPPQARTRGARKAHPAAVAGKAHPCAPASLVLSLFAARYSYPAHTLPRFQVDVVSTAPGACRFSLGGGHVQLLIKSGGIHRVWDSADCSRPATVTPTRLARGVPAVVQFTWDRKTSAPGCRVPGRAARPGTYTATASSGRLSSQSVIFVLRAPGIAVP